MQINLLVFPADIEHGIKGGDTPQQMQNEGSDFI